jgi:hypothetical protein
MNKIYNNELIAKIKFWARAGMTAPILIRYKKWGNMKLNKIKINIKEDLIAKKLEPKLYFNLYNIISNPIKIRDSTFVRLIELFVTEKKCKNKE